MDPVAAEIDFGGPIEFQTVPAIPGDGVPFEDVGAAPGVRDQDTIAAMLSYFVILKPDDPVFRIDPDPVETGGCSVEVIARDGNVCIGPSGVLCILFRLSVISSVALNQLRRAMPSFAPPAGSISKPSIMIWLEALNSKPRTTGKPMPCTTIGRSSSPCL